MRLGQHDPAHRGIDEEADEARRRSMLHVPQQLDVKTA